MTKQADFVEEIICLLEIITLMKCKKQFVSQKRSICFYASIASMSCYVYQSQHFMRSSIQAVSDKTFFFGGRGSWGHTSRQYSGLNPDFFWVWMVSGQNVKFFLNYYLLFFIYCIYFYNIYILLHSQSTTFILSFNNFKMKVLYILMFL